jgi:hypothetical protein
MMNAAKALRPSTKPISMIRNLPVMVVEYIVRKVEQIQAF